MVMTSAWPSPTRVPWPRAQVLIFHVLRFSGIGIVSSAWPFLISRDVCFPKGSVEKVFTD